MQKTPNQKGFTKKVKRVCSFKTFNASKREKLKQKLGSVEKDHETIEMERDEAEEKCLVQQQVIMDQMKQLKKLDADIENQDSYYADQVDQEAKRLEEIIWLAERIINIQILHNKAEEELKSKNALIHTLKSSRTRTMSEPPVPMAKQVKRSHSINCASDASGGGSRNSIRRKQWFNSLYTPRRMRPASETTNTIRPFSLAMVGYDTTSGSRLCRVEKKNKVGDKLNANSTIKRSSSDVALAERGKLLYKERKTTVCDTDSDTGISSLHSSENDFRYSPPPVRRQQRPPPDKKETLV